VDARAADPTIYEVGTPVRRIAKAELDDKVIKSGRTTGVTRGIVTRIATLTQLDFGHGVVREIGGFEIGPDPEHPAPSNEISRGGDSGSAWLAVGPGDDATDIMVGLHFGGDDENSDGEYALAAKRIRSSRNSRSNRSVQARLKPSRSRRSRSCEAATIPPFSERSFRFRPSARPHGTIWRNSMGTRSCATAISRSGSAGDDASPAWWPGTSTAGTIRYLGRKGLDFTKDDRGNLEELQIGDELYANNPFDRGHVARRADLCWGDRKKPQWRTRTASTSRT
jgi:endonuclease G